jgi:MFS family permease
VVLPLLHCTALFVQLHSSSFNCTPFRSTTRLFVQRRSLRSLYSPTHVPSYAVDSLILLIQSIIAGQAALEFKPSYANGLTIVAYVGMLVGALFWGIGADVIGRKTAFNFSLLICSVFAIVAGASPNWEVLGLFVCLSSFGAGGNLVLDTAVFLEYLPSSRQWMLTLMAAWWGELARRFYMVYLLLFL